MAKFNLDAKQAIQEIKSLVSEIEELKKKTRSMSDATAANFTAMENQVSGLRNKISHLGNRIKYLETLLRKNTTETGKNTKALKQNSKEVVVNTKSKKKNADANKEASKAQKSFNISLKDFVRGGIAIRAIQLLESLAVSTYENIKALDSLSFTLSTITENSLDYENSQRFLLRITKAYGVELINTTVRWSRFLAAAKESNLSLRETENIFESMTKASAVLGLNTEELTSVYLALEQMLSKGKVTTEELRRQLGERLPGAMGIMAAALGVTIPELDKMLKKGEVLSADVLPKFAEALERAYGIENADRIETLVAQQNRLTAAWQTFIKNVSEGDSVIRRTLGGAFDFITGTVDAWNELLSSDDQRLRIEIGNEEQRQRGAIERSSSQFIDLLSPVEEQEIALKALEKRLLEETRTASSSRQKVIRDELDNIARIRAEKGQEVLERNKEIANENIKIAYAEFTASKELYDQIRQDFEDVRGGLKVVPEYDQTALNKARQDLIKTEARYNLFRKLVQESDVEFIDDDEPGKTQRRLRRIKDYYLETMNELAKVPRDTALDRFNDDTLNIEDRLTSLQDYTRAATTIRRNEHSIAIRDAEQRYESELKSLQESVNNGSVSAAKAAQFRKDIEKEKVDFIRLQEVKLSNDVIAINRKAAKDLAKVTKEVFDSAALRSTEDVFTKRIIAAKNEFEASAKTNKDRQKLERDLAEVAIEQTNAIIDVKIKLLNEEIRVLEKSSDNNSEYINKLIQDRNKLESQKQIKPPIDEDNWRKVFDEAMDLAREFTSSVGDLFSARFDRRIEFINAEIDAEEKKYARLIELAEGDEEQQKTLERNKRERIEKLERKRLKEQQKQAKLQKAFAVADVGFNTARAIMGIWADFPKFDFGATAAIMTGVVSALGAAQIATILSTPIPQYKEGVTNLSKDQIAMINDGSFKEYIERNNRILSTDKKNAIVPLKKGDTVYKNYDDMVSRSSIFNNNSSVIRAAQAKNDKDFKDVTKAVMKGINKAKINNELEVVINNDDYRREMTGW